MKYCSECAASVSLRVPEGDNRPRYVCDRCQTIHYQNPRIVAGCVVEHEGRILLCKRAIEPRYGLWTLPAGFMENEETTIQAAARETWEEAQLVAEEDIPWDALAFPVVRETLKLYLDDRRAGHFPLHVGDIERLSQDPPRYRIELLE